MSSTPSARARTAASNSRAPAASRMSSAGRSRRGCLNASYTSSYARVGGRRARQLAHEPQLLVVADVREVPAQRRHELRHLPSLRGFGNRREQAERAAARLLERGDDLRLRDHVWFDDHVRRHVKRWRDVRPSRRAGRRQGSGIGGRIARRTPRPRRRWPGRLPSARARGGRRRSTTARPRRARGRAAPHGPPCSSARAPGAVAAVAHSAASGSSSSATVIATATGHHSSGSASIMRSSSHPRGRTGGKRVVT